jgi:K+-transporting ATPase ATPase C chain
LPYNAAASSGSNFGPLHPDVKDAAAARIAALQAAGSPSERIPVDLVTASASGLDPHISPAAAEFQVSRIAALRRIPEETLRDLVRRYTEDRQFGVLGEPRVNVLRLNLALDQRNVD